MAAQKNAAVNPYGLHISSDGKRILMPAGGGWRPPPEGGSGENGTAVFSTDKLDSIVGQVVRLRHDLAPAVQPRRH